MDKTEMLYGPPPAYSAEDLRRLKFYTVPKSRRLRETIARLKRELEGFVCSDENLKTTWNEKDHPRGQPDNKGQFVEKDKQTVATDTEAKSKKTEKAFFDYSKAKNEGRSLYELTQNGDQEMRAQLSDEMKTRGIYTDFDESGKETIEYIPVIHDRIKNDFNGIESMCKEIVYTDFFDDKDGAAYNPQTKQIHYNKNIFNSKENMRKYIDSEPGWFASTDIQGVIAHEYGHAVYNLIKQKRKIKDDDIERVINVLMAKNGITTTVDREREISKYAAMSHQELISEAVSDVYTMKDPRAICKKVFDLVKYLAGGT